MSNYLITSFIAGLVGANCSLLGTFLVLRKQTMLGDAISHAVFPGIVLAFLFTASLAPWLTWIGALLAGMVAIFFIAFFQNKIQLDSDVSIGFVFTSFFAFGLLLTSLYTEKVDLDLECVLYGNIALQVLETWSWQGVYLGNPSCWQFSLLLLGNTTAIFLFFRPWFLTSFDMGYAQVIGYTTTRWHYLLMLFVVFTLTLVFKIVGSILPLGFLVFPPLILHLLQCSFTIILVGSVLISFFFACTGVYLAVLFNTSIPGTILLLEGLCFAISFAYTRVKIFAHRHSP